MKFFSFLALALVTVATIAVMWSRAKWATAIPEAGMCLTAALWAALLLAGYQQRVRRSWVMAPLAAIVGLAMIQVFLGTTVYAWPTRMAAFYWAGNLATFFVALQIFDERSWRVRYLDALLIFSVLLAIFSTSQAMTSPVGTIYWTFQDPLITNNVFGPFLYVNQYSAFVELVLPIAMYAALTRPQGRALFAIAAAILAGSVITGGSKGGFALIVGEVIAVAALVSWRKGISRRQVINSGAVLAVALLWFAVMAGSDTLISKLSHSDWLAGRSDFNRSSVAMIKARPFRGFGLGNWATAYPGYASFDDGRHTNQAHNDWLQWTVEGGIPMLLIMLSVAIWAIPRAIRSIWGLGVAVIFIHCLWDYPIQRTGVAIVFFTMMAAIAPYGRPRRESTTPGAP